MFSILHGKCQLQSQLKSIVKWFFKTVSMAVILTILSVVFSLLIQFQGRSQQEMTFLTMAELSHSVLASTIR